MPLDALALTDNQMERSCTLPHRFILTCVPRSSKASPRPSLAISSAMA
jgi:hypothetical protein